MKVSVAGTLALKKVGKKFTNHSARKTTVSKLRKAKIVSSELIAKVSGHRGINSLVGNTGNTTCICFAS